MEVESLSDEYNSLKENIVEALRLAKAGIQNKLTVYQKANGHAEVTCGEDPGLTGFVKTVRIRETRDPRSKTYIHPIHSVMKLVLKGKLRTAYSRLCQIIADVQQKESEETLEFSSTSMDFLTDAQDNLVEILGIAKRHNYLELGIGVYKK